VNSLVSRLTKQVGSRSLAINLLKKRGHLDKNGNLTDAGRVRQDLGAAGRAKSREAKYQGGRPSDYIYNKRTNRATKRK
jgi:hypothetical protein